MDVADYIAALETGREKLAATGLTADVRGIDPPSIGSFLFATSPKGAVEISIDANQWYVEFWHVDSENPSSDAMLDSLSTAIDAARDWLIGD